MNRKKKINSILRKKAKKANAKLAPKGKSSYVSKADRAALELSEQELSQEQDATTESTDNTPPKTTE